MHVALAALPMITAAMGAAASAGGIASVLSAVGTVTSILGTIGAGRAKQNQANQAAAQSTIEAGQTRVDNLNRQVQAKRNLARILGQNDVTFAAAGVDISAGIAANNRQRETSQVTGDLSVDRGDQEYRAALLKTRAHNQRKAGKRAFQASLISAAGKGIGAVAGSMGRGGGGSQSDRWAGLRTV